jgi:hypothetical protein
MWLIGCPQVEQTALRTNRLLDRVRFLVCLAASLTSGDHV